MKGYVYLICDPANETYKIGVTRDKESKRLEKLQTGNCTELFISHIYETNYPFRLETMLHSHFKNQNAKNEWFYLEPSDVFNFNKICETINNRIEALLDNPFFSKDIK